MAPPSRPLLDVESPLSIRVQWARRHAINSVKEDWNRLVRLAHGRRPDDSNFDAPELITGDELPDAPLQVPQGHSGDGDAPLPVKVGIIGAGAAGLFTALILEYVNKTQSSVVFTYDILEADPQRSGGRLYTHNFSTTAHDYFDVGAMRFPDHPVMTRLFSLFTKMEMNTAALNPNGSPDPPLGSLIPYYITNYTDSPKDKIAQEPYRFNNINQWGSYNSIAVANGSDPWQFNTDQSTNIDPDLLKLKQSPDYILNTLLEPIRSQLRDDITNNTNTGWNTLMRLDGLTMTGFLTSPWPEILAKPSVDIPLPPYNYDTAQWFETFNGGTNWYDQAFSEAVLESLDFEYAKPVPGGGAPPKENDDDDADYPWWCILGGAQQLAARMEAEVNRSSGNPQKVQYSSQVTAIKQVDTMSVDVVVNGEVGSNERGGTTNNYNCVVNTTPLGCLEHMDTTAAGLNSATRTAIRSLGYGPSCKVAIKFNTPWWINLPSDIAVKMGGLGHSDLNIRTCVYPSYNIYDKGSAVLLCSYSWQQDAERLGSLMTGDASSETQLKQLIINDLVKLHSGGSLTPDQLYDIINPAYVTHFAWDWYKAPNAAEAFAFFRPFQFSTLWGHMIIPSGDVVVAGEHASPHHAWVVGALESAVHGLAAWCSVNEAKYPALGDVLTVLEGTGDPGNPYVGLPLYMDLNLARWQGALGLYSRQETLERRKDDAVLARGSTDSPSRTAARQKRASDFLTKLGIKHVSLKV